MTPLPPAAPGSHWQPVEDDKGQPTQIWERARQYKPYGYLDTTDPAQRATLAAYQSAAWGDEVARLKLLPPIEPYWTARNYADDWEVVRVKAMREARA